MIRIPPIMIPGQDPYICVFHLHHRTVTTSTTVTERPVSRKSTSQKNRNRPHKLLQKRYDTEYRYTGARMFQVGQASNT